MTISHYPSTDASDTALKYEQLCRAASQTTLRGHYAWTKRRTSPLESLLTNSRPSRANASPTGRMHVPGQLVRFAACTSVSYPAPDDGGAAGSVSPNGTLSRGHAMSVREKRESERRGGDRTGRRSSPWAARG